MPLRCQQTSGVGPVFPLHVRQLTSRAPPELLPCAPRLLQGPRVPTSLSLLLPYMSFSTQHTSAPPPPAPMFLVRSGALSPFPPGDLTHVPPPPWVTAWSLCCQQRLQPLLCDSSTRHVFWCQNTVMFCPPGCPALVSLLLCIGNPSYSLSPTGPDP